ncbi:hypothetical protein EYF80_018015 [Liparis tanakae]|uniref:Uncharacterized protein n=1 Tax=Liparis tanakae TaxID=230148 RepID=A0A4Z2I2X1_9TELE|nr:hypothetical protein EYF80_018015 [Liparis tanakae]
MRASGAARQHRTLSSLRETVLLYAAVFKRFPLLRKPGAKTHNPMNVRQGPAAGIGALKILGLQRKAKGDVTGLSDSGPDVEPDVIRTGILNAPDYVKWIQQCYSHMFIQMVRESCKGIRSLTN